MSGIGKIEKKVGSKFLSYYEVEAIHRDGSITPYYVVSRNPDKDTLKAVTKENPPDGVVIYGIYGRNKDKIVLIRQYRYPIGDYVYELPAGLMEAGEYIESTAVREMYEETGLRFTPVEGGDYSHPFFTTVGMTDESCATVYGMCEGQPSSEHQESSEDIQVVIADKAECRRILKEEKVAANCAYLLLHFLTSDDPLDFGL